MATTIKRGGKAVSRRGKAITTRKPAMAQQPRVPSLKQRVQDHADSAVRSLMDQHPLVKRMRSDMHQAIMGVVRGPGARGRRTSMFDR